MTGHDAGITGHVRPEYPGFGLQYCPTCLLEDATPYFRKRWRVALNTVCGVHKTLLKDRCTNCAAAIAAHRIDFNRFAPVEDATLSFCHQCNFDLRVAPAVEPTRYDAESCATMLSACNGVDDGTTGEWSLDRYTVFHQLCKIMATRYEHVGLRDFILREIGVRDIVLTQGHVSFEMRPIAERHHLLQLAAWLLVDIEPRLYAAWRSGAVRYNVLRKDFPESPDWYDRIVGKFANWRTR